MYTAVILRNWTAANHAQPFIHGRDSKDKLVKRSQKSGHFLLWPLAGGGIMVIPRSWTKHSHIIIREVTLLKCCICSGVKCGVTAFEVCNSDSMLPSHSAILTVSANEYL